MRSDQIVILACALSLVLLGWWALVTGAAPAWGVALWWIGIGTLTEASANDWRKVDP